MKPARAGAAALLGVAVAVSAGLVIAAFLPAPHNGGDNAAYVSLGHALVTEGAYVDAYDPLRAPHTKYPPLFPLLLGAMMLAGASTWVAFKWAVAALTVAGVAVTFLLARVRLPPRESFVVAILVAGAAATIEYSRWVLSDPLFVLLTLVGLWAVERARRGVADAEGAGPPPAAAPSARWLALGAAAALAAYFTRQAGLPLLVAILGWLALERRGRALGLTAAAFAVPALLWTLRGLGGAGEGDYASEFWMVDPYQPALGTIGPLDLFGRAATNAGAYLGRHGPIALAGEPTGLAVLLFVLVLVAAGAGWAVRLRRGRPGPLELFLPLYAGLILLWPPVWAGDRFILPLLAPAFVYAAESAALVRARLGALAAPLLGLAIGLLLVVQLGGWVRDVRTARACAPLVEAEGPFACYGSGVTELVEAAGWAGASLPEGAAVMTRKPRIFYVQSGVPSRTFPFDPSPEAQLAEADRVGVRYVLLDRWDPLASRYVGRAVRARPGAFCFVRGFGPGPAGSTQLLGILPPELRVGEPAAGAGGGVRIELCPEGYVREGAPAPGTGAPATDEPAYSSPSSGEIPLLALPRR